MYGERKRRRKIKKRMVREEEEERARGKNNISLKSEINIYFNGFSIF